MNTGFWINEFLGNSIKDYILALAIFAGISLLSALFQRYVLHRLEKLAQKTKTDIDDMMIRVFGTIKPPFYFFIAFYVALWTLSFPDLVHQIGGAILIVWAVYLFTKAVQIVINYIFQRRLEGEDDRGTKSAINAVNFIARLLIWSLGLLLVLSNLGVDITSLIAGLGIGGIAVALAAQNILSDLFSSFAIHFDKPFVVGDFIVVGEHMGTVEKVGIKTTRVRALQGEEIVISNQELTSTRVQNFKKMKERRISFELGVTYSTSSEQLKKIPGLIKSAVDNTELAKFDRAHFREFGDFSLIFEVVYYTQSPEYNDYMDSRQQINLAIKGAFENEGIKIAFPTQTIILNKISKKS